MARASSFSIETVHGRTILVAGYWMEGQEIKFYWAGGVVGIPRGLVKHIREISDPLNPRILEEAMQLSRIERWQPTPTEPQPHPSSPSASPRPGLDEHDVAAIAAFEARTQRLRSLSKEELIALARDGAALRERLLTSGQPYYEDTHVMKLYTLLDAVAARIRQTP